MCSFCVTAGCYPTVTFRTTTRYLRGDPIAAKSNRKITKGKSEASKPPKPYPGFPLTLHNGGNWMKKIRGKSHYFGRWGKPASTGADELSGWFRSQGQFKGGRGDDRQHWLSIRSGMQIICNRKGADPIIIDNPQLCITGGLQPDVLPEFIGNECEDGFSARMLFAYADPVPSKNWNDDVIQKSDEFSRV